MMSAEKNVHVISVEHLLELLGKFIDIHLWGERQSLYKEHGVLKFQDIWVLSLVPEDLDWLTEGSWNETTVWGDSDWDWS